MGKKKVFASFALCLVETVHKNREFCCSANRGFYTQRYVSWGSIFAVIYHTRLFHWTVRLKVKLWRWIYYGAFEIKKHDGLDAVERHQPGEHGR